MLCLRCKDIILLNDTPSDIGKHLHGMCHAADTEEVSFQNGNSLDLVHVGLISDPNRFRCYGQCRKCCAMIKIDDIMEPELSIFAHKALFH